MKKLSKNKGQLIILATVFMGIVTLIMVALVGYSGVQIKSHRQAVAREQALDIAEAGLEKAVWKFNNQPGYSGETGTAFSNGVYNITVTNLSGSSKIVRADAYVPNATFPTAKRGVQLTISTDTQNIAFNYGVQVGQGGLSMQNSSQIIGNVYSGGNIEGENSASITGTVIVSGSTGTIDDMIISGNTMSHTLTDSTVSGNANHYTVSGSTIAGNVSANSISFCTISGNAVYNTRSSCTVTGTFTTPNPSVPSDPEAIPLPISDDQITAWEQEAEAGGIIASQSYSSGTRSLGPKKINGNLTVTNSATLVITGALWVTGQITFSNSAIIKLDPSFGGQSGVIVAGVKDSTTAGYIDLNNSVQIQGSGTAGSYLLLLSERVGTNVTAIDAGNSGTASILYAGKGKIIINNSGQFKEITAALIALSNSATITYESGLANPNFTSGPGGGWSVLRQSWQLLQ